MKPTNELLDYMAFFDDDSASDGTWQALLEDGVKQYNMDNHTRFDPFDAFMAYVEWKSLK